MPVVVAILAWLHRLMVPRDQRIDALGDVAHLALGVEDQAAAMGQVGAGAVHAEEVGEARHGDPEEGRRTLAPQLAQVDPVPAGHRHGRQHLGGPEPGGVHQHVRLVALTVDGDDGGGLDVVDAGAHQIDVVAQQCRQPRSIVLECALPRGRVVGHHLGDEFGMIADLAHDPVGEHLSGELVRLADGPLLIGVVRVHACRLEALVAAGPEDEEAIPPAVEGEVAQGPAHAGPHGGVVVRVGEHPLRRSLEHGQVADLGGDGRGDLEAAGPGSDHGHSLAGQVDVMVPAGRVERRALERVRAFDDGHVRPVELSDCRDHGPCSQHVLGPVGGPGAHGPGGRVLVPGRPHHLGLPSDVRSDAVLVHDGLEVALQLGLLGEELGPVVARLEAVAVEVVADVDSGPGVRVLPPSTADARVLLHDGERDAGFRQPDAGEQTRLPAPDDDDWEGCTSSWIADGVDPAGIASVELHLLHQHGHVLVGDVLAHQPRHHLVQ